MAIVDFENWAKETNGYYSNWFDLLGDLSISGDNLGPFNYGRYVSGAAFGRIFPTPINDFWFQFHFYALSGPYGFANPMVSFQNSSSIDHASIGIDYATRKSYLNYQGGVKTSSDPVFVYNSWNFAQVRLHVGNSDGSIQLWINGVLVDSVSNVDTETSGGPTVHQWRLNSGNWIRFANLVVYTESGNTPNARTPETRIYTVQPNGAGASSDFTPNGAATNWQCQIDNPSDGDTTYTSAASAPSSDLFVCPNSPIAVGAAVYAVGVEIDVRKDDAGTNQIDELLRSGGTTYAAGNPSNLTSTYQRFRAFWDRDPATAAVWTIANANSAQPGYRRTA
jgi:hypothetical protein